MGIFCAREQDKTRVRDWKIEDEHTDDDRLRLFVDGVGVWWSLFLGRRLGGLVESLTLVGGEARRGRRRYTGLDCTLTGHDDDQIELSMRCKSFERRELV